jgi:hypothetical protein
MKGGQEMKINVAFGLVFLCVTCTSCLADPNEKKQFPSLGCHNY